MKQETAIVGEACLNVVRLTIAQAVEFIPVVESYATTRPESR